LSDRAFVTEATPKTPGRKRRDDVSIRERVDRAAKRWSWRKLTIALLISICLGSVGLTWATVLYIRSGFPPALISGQLAFSPESFRAWYAVLLEKGTLHVYVWTQIVDYLFIIGLLATLFIVHLMIAKAQPNPGWRRLALTFAILAPAIAASDAIENIVTLSMLANPTNFSPALAYLASTFSAIKWTWASIGSALICIQLGALAWWLLLASSKRSIS
jgi:hypothetical protein